MTQSTPRQRGSLQKGKQVTPDSLTAPGDSIERLESATAAGS